MGVKFGRVVVIGYGKATGTILKYIEEQRQAYGYSLEFIEHESHALSITRKICEEAGIPYAYMPDKKELSAYLCGIVEKTLIVSASNNFLFPAACVEKDNITIINFHNALLPAYPGRNAPSWAIYKGERETGITWHYVTAGIDEGNIIIQKRCAVGPDDKAYELTERLMDLACEGFEECFAAILEERAKTLSQGEVSGRRMYRSYEVPGDGAFDLHEKPEDIYRLLRSVDYGKSDIFPAIQTVIDKTKVEVIRYRKIVPEKKKEEEHVIYLPLGQTHFLKIKYRPV